MSAHASSSSAPPPLPPPTHPLTNPRGNPPTSISPTLPSSSSSAQSPSISMTSPSVHSPETARQIAEARAALEASMANIGSSLDINLRSRAQDLHSNSKQLEKQQKDVVKATEALRKESDKLKKVADEGMKRVKELGNVQNWAEMLERDFLVLEETLRLVERGSESEGSSYTGSEWESGSEGSRDEESRREPPVGLEGAEGKKIDNGEGAREPAGPLQVEEREAEREESRSNVIPVEMPGAKNIDADGDTNMDDMESEPQDKGKAKAIHVIGEISTEEHTAPTAGGSSTATATTSSTSDPSSSSVHTAASVAS